MADQHQEAAHLEGEEDEEDAENEERSQPAQSRSEGEARLHEDEQKEKGLGAGGREAVRPNFATACSLLLASWLSGLHATALCIYRTVS